MPNPFLPISLLWINIVTDGLPSLALSVEPVRKNYLENSPGPSTKNFFDKKFIGEMLTAGLLITGIELVVYQYALKHGNLAFAKSIAFNLMVYLTLFRSFSCRSETLTYFHLKFNPYHLLSVLLPIALQVMLEYNNYFKSIFGLTTLTLAEHGILIGISCIPIFLFESYKRVLNKKP